MEIGDQFGVALLALFGTLLVRRFQLPRRLFPLVSIVLSIGIVWMFIGEQSVAEVVWSGLVSGLLANGMLLVLLGGPE
ncbi:MAG: hypothetical protein O2954_04610 [bacterium]|nr:hypothetical protein [bacterium]